MMRAAVELTEADTLELGAFHSRQSIILADAEKTPMHPRILQRRCHMPFFQKAKGSTIDCKMSQLTDNASDLRATKNNRRSFARVRGEYGSG